VNKSHENPDFATADGVAVLFRRFAEMPDITTADEVAGLFQVSSTTVYQWARSGQLPALPLGRLVRFRKPDVLRFAGFTDPQGGDEPS
jgi:excisionase family DNA binding protein